MEFSLSDEQRLIIKTTRDFVTHELMPHEAEIEATGVLRPELHRELKAKAIDAGLYAANMPAEVGGAGLDRLGLELAVELRAQHARRLDLGLVRHQLVRDEVARSLDDQALLVGQ